MSNSDRISLKFTNASERNRFILFFSICICILAISFAFFVLSVNKPFMGLSLSLSPQGWIVDSVDENGAAIQAGIQVGDRPLEINGLPASDFLSKYTEPGSVIGVLIQKITVSDISGQIKSVNLDESSIPLTSQTTLMTWFIVSLIFWIMGFYVFFKRPRNPASRLFCICGLVLGLALSSTIAGERLIPFAMQLSVIASVVGPWFLLHFFMILPEEGTWATRNPLVYIIYLPAFLTVILYPFIGYADGQPLSWFRSVRLLEYGLGFIAVIGVVIFNYTHTSSPRTRQQMKTILFSCLAALMPILVLFIIPEAVSGRTVFPEGFSMLSIAFIPLGMGYAILTTKLMDIDIIIRRSVIYGLVTVGMAIILSLAIFPILQFQKSFGTFEQILIVLALGAVATGLFGPVKKYIENVVDKFFYKDRYDYRQIIQNLNLSMNATTELTDISRLIVGTITRTLNLAGCCLLIKGQSHYYDVKAAEGTFTNADLQNKCMIMVFKRNSLTEFPNSASSRYPEIAFFIPLKSGNNEVGFLCLSQKTSRQNFSSDDIFLLQGVSSVAATALQNAMLARDVSLRDTFVSIASHELRTPLTSIVGYADLMLRREHSQAVRQQWLNNILENGQRITNMVDDLLNVTRIQSGKLAVKLGPVNLKDLINDRLFIIRESTNKHDFIIDLEPELPLALADYDKLGQIMVNLLSNAVKYSPSGGKVSISARKDNIRNCLIMSVADEGFGISPEDKDTLFKTFHRIQRPETRGIRGSGLGLYIVKEFIEAMNGEVWLDSQLNHGSTFFVSVPIYVPAENSTGRPDIQVVDKIIDTGL